MCCRPSGRVARRSARPIRAPALFIAAGVCLGAATPLLYQSPQTPVYKAGVDLVMLDVTVVDRDGTPVTGLTAADFDVRIDGQRRQVRALDYLQYGVATPTVASARGAAPAPPSRGGRVIVFLFDDLSIKPGEAEGLQIAAERTLASLDPDDLVGLTTASGLGPAVSPTRDRRAIVTELRNKRLVGRNDESTSPFVITVKEADDFMRFPRNFGPVASRECGALGLGEPCRPMIEATARRLYSATVHRVAQQMAAYRATIDAMKTAPKPRVLVALTAGIAIGVGGDEQDLLEPLSRAAADAEVQFYAMSEVADAVDLREQSAGGLPGDDRPSARRNEHEFLTSGMKSVAIATGGEAFTVIGQGDRFFTRIYNETSGVYRLGVETPSRPDRRYLDIKVAVARPRVTVRAHRHAVAPGVAAPVEPVERTLQMRLAQGGLAFGVPIALGTAIRREAGRLQLAIEAQVPAATPGPLIVMFAVVNAAGSIVQSGRRDVSVTGDDAYRIALAVPLDPGSYRLRLAVADAAGQIGSLQRAIAAQLTRFGPVVVSDLFLSWSAGDGPPRFLALDALPPAATSIRASLEVYPDPGPIKQGELAARFSLRRSEDATPIASRDVPARAGDGVLVMSATLPSGTLPPGPYIIEIHLMRAGAVLGKLTGVFRKAF